MIKASLDVRVRICQIAQSMNPFLSKATVRAMVAAVLCACVVSGYGDTLDRTNWYDSSGLMTATPGHLEMPLTNNIPTGQFFTTYVAPTNAPIVLSHPGDQVKVTWSFTPSGVDSFTTDISLAFALFFTPDIDRLTADGAPVTANYAGYAGFFDCAYAGQAGMFLTLELGNITNPSTPGPLFQGFGPQVGGAVGWSIQAVNYTSLWAPNGVPVVFTLTLTRDASGSLSVNSIAVSGTNIINQVSYIDSSPQTFSFNSACIYNPGQGWDAQGLLDTTQFQVEFKSGSPSIDAPPNSQSCFPGNNVTFAAGVSGAEPLSYQWTYNGTNLVDQTNAALTVSNVQYSQSGNYAIVVTNQYGSATNTAVLTVNPPSSRVPPPPGLISWWPADGNALDAVGGNNGTLVNDVVYANGRADGQCFLIDGGNAGVDVGVAANLQLQDFTIETWIQRTWASIASYNGGPGMFFSYGTDGYGFGINDDGTLLLTEVGVDSVASPTGITDTGWHHVAVTKSGTNVVFYIDGAAAWTTNYSSSFDFSTSALIGAEPPVDPGFPANSFVGAIDEMSIYGRALSAAEISMVAGSGGGKLQQLPGLQISISDTNAVVTWPVWASTFSLESASDATGLAGSWSAVTNPAQSQGLDMTAEIPLSGSQQFFRLSYPTP